MQRLSDAAISDAIDARKSNNFLELITADPFFATYIYLFVLQFIFDFYNSSLMTICFLLQGKILIKHRRCVPFFIEGFKLFEEFINYLNLLYNVICIGDIQI